MHKKYTLRVIIYNLLIINTISVVFAQQGKCCVRMGRQEQ